MSVGQKRKIAQVILVAVLFAILWPPVMAAFQFCVWLPVFYLTLYRSYDEVIQAAMWLPFNIVFSYVLWFVPALLTGVYVATVTALARDRRIIKVSALLLGGTVAAIGAGLEQAGARAAIVIAFIAGALAMAVLWQAVHWLRASKPHWLGFTPEAAS